MNRREYIRQGMKILKTAPWFEIGVGLTFWVTLYVLCAVLGR